VEQPDRNEALERLNALVGEWTLEAGPPEGPPWPGDARVSFEWLEGQTWLIEHWNVDLPEAPDGIAVIGLKDAPADAKADVSGEAFLQHYFDSRGVHRIYQMSIDDGEWKLWREGPPFDQRFTGTFSDDGNTIVGRWERTDDDSNWIVDFDFTYTKVS
jgi:hypothetical protein